MDDQNSRLFETEARKGGKKRKVFAASVLVCILWIWVYRATQLPSLKATATGVVALNGGRTWYCIGMLVSEILLGLYWMLTQSVRWNPTYRRTFKQRLAQRYSASRPEGYDLMLWGDLHTLFEPDEDDEIWKNQHEYNVISWSLYDFCGIHILLMQNGISLHNAEQEKNNPLSQEIISKNVKKNKS
ncbi:hypothetical protein Tco_0884175 [Tanacetum coccineum]